MAMRKCFALLFIAALFITILPLAHANDPELPDDIMSMLRAPAWADYEIGYVNFGDALLDYNSRACYYYDQRGQAAAFVLLHSEWQNVLCIFEKKSTGEWYLVDKSSSAVLQNSRIPLITAEEYGQFDVSYLDDERQCNLGLTFKRRDDGWYISHISKLDNNLGIAIDIYDNRLVFIEEKNNWEKTTVSGVNACEFAQFHIDSFPLSVQAAKESLSPPHDIPVSPN